MPGSRGKRLCHQTRGTRTSVQRAPCVDSGNRPFREFRRGGRLMDRTTAAARAPAAHQQNPLLLVDDNAENLVSLEAMLHGITDEMVLARSGEEALRHVLEYEDFAAILLDV